MPTQPNKQTIQTSNYRLSVTEDGYLTLTVLKSGESYVNDCLIKAITQTTGLVLVAENATGNVCFAQNNKDLRDEFKQTFTPSDLLRYADAVLRTTTDGDISERLFSLIPTPPSASVFWEEIAKGKD